MVNQELINKILQLAYKTHRTKKHKPIHKKKKKKKQDSCKCDRKKNHQSHGTHKTHTHKKSKHKKKPQIIFIDSYRRKSRRDVKPLENSGSDLTDHDNFKQTSARITVVDLSDVESLSCSDKTY